jgi:putative ABC transport system substrate-binding protein
MKKLTLTIFVILILTPIIIYKTKQPKQYTIAIIQCASNKALNLLTDTFIKEINKLTKKNNLTIIHKNAQASIANAQAIAQQLYINKDIDLFFTIGSSTSQAIATLEKKRPIIIAGVSDPNSYNLNKENICGTIETIDEKSILDMINNTHNNIKTVGILRTAGDIHEKEFIYFKELCKNNNKKVSDFAVNSETEIITIIENICQKIELLLIPCDSLVVSVLPYIIKTTKKYKIPVFTCFIEGVEEGAFASTGVDYQLNGIQCAEIAKKIISQETTAEDIGLKKSTYKSIYYNKSLFNLFNINIEKNLSKNNITYINIE